MAQKSETIPVATLAIVLDDKGQVHITSPEDKKIALSLLLDAIRIIALREEKKTESAIIKTGMNLGGITTDIIH